MSELVLARPGIAQRAEAHWANFVPLGLAYVAASARAHGIDVQIVDGKLEGHVTADQTVDAILRHRPRVVGLSAFTVDYPRAAEIALKLKNQADAPITVLGGVHANALPRESLQEAPGVDYVIAGEGESALVALVQDLRAGHAPVLAPGVYCRDGSGAVCGLDHTPFEDLEKLPFPAWELFPRSPTYPLMTHRGCPFKCVFCSRNMTQRVRSRSPTHVMEEVRWLHRTFAPRRIRFEDETFGLHSGATEELLGRLAEFNRQAGLRFWAGTRVDRLSEETFRRMKQAGFDCVEFGVESGSPEVLSRSGKNIDLTMVRESVRRAKQAGLKVWVNFIIGLPGETPATVRQSIDLAVELNPDTLSVAVVVPYPGSDIYRWAHSGGHGYRLISEDWGQYDKYLGAPCELETLDYGTMKRLQGRMYFEVYARNARLSQLLRLIWNERAVAWSLGRGMLRRRADP
jgi:anaerobic magnesium-protoporphyrin IX monomethyl ester cyclase